MSGAVLDALASLSIGAKPTCLQHEPATSQVEWSETLKAHASEAPESYRVLKTLVFKPKTGKADTPIPLVVLTDDATQTSTGAIGAHLKLKELRLAVPELLQATLGATKDDGRWLC